MHWLSAGSEILRVQDCSQRTSTNCTPSQLTEGLNFLEYIPFATTVISPRYGQYKWTRIRSTGFDAALRATVTPKVTGQSHTGTDKDVSERRPSESFDSVSDM